MFFILCIPFFCLVNITLNQADGSVTGFNQIRKLLRSGSHSAEDNDQRDNSNSPYFCREGVLQHKIAVATDTSSPERPYDPIKAALESIPA